MKQILHIFKKDTRHFWPEILTCLVTLTIFVLIYPARWRLVGDRASSSALNSILTLVIPLMPLTWCLLVTRLVHAEGLVGDSHFWQTRPYEWKKLLAAKLLFLAVWLFVPGMIAQSALLVEAGFAPLAYMRGVLLLVLFLGGLFLVPMMALAAVTANFARMLLSLLGIIFIWPAFGFLSSLSAGYSSTDPNPRHMLIPWLMVLFSAAAIAAQYSRRRVWLGRGLLLAMGLLVGIALHAAGGSHESAIDRAYPAASDAMPSPVQLAFAPTARRPLQVVPSERAGKVYLEIPLQYSGVMEGSVVQVDDVKFMIYGPGGFHFAAPWWTSPPWRYRPGAGASMVEIMLSREQYDRLKGQPLNLHLTLAVTRLDAGDVVRVPIAEQDFEVPGVAVCSAHNIYRQVGVFCRSAFQEPAVTDIATTWSDAPCSGPQPDADLIHAGLIPEWNQWVGTRDRGQIKLLSVADWNTGTATHSMDDRQLTLCPGTLVTFTQYHVAEQTRAELTIPDFHLPPDTIR